MGDFPVGYVSLPEATIEGLHFCLASVFHDDKGVWFDPTVDASSSNTLSYFHMSSWFTSLMAMFDRNGWLHVLFRWFARWRPSCRSALPTNFLLGILESQQFLAKNLSVDCWSKSSSVWSKCATTATVLRSIVFFWWNPKVFHRLTPIIYIS